MNDVTLILSAVEQGEPQAAERLLALVYAELRRLAARKLAHEKPGQTLDATALVHEAYLRLFGDDGEQQHWDSRSHFFTAAAEAMRRILIDNARRKKRRKHGGDRQRVALLDEDLAIHDSADELLALDDGHRQTGLGGRDFGSAAEAPSIHRAVDRASGRGARLLAGNGLSTLELREGMAPLRDAREEQFDRNRLTLLDFVRQIRRNVACRFESFKPAG